MNYILLNLFLTAFLISLSLAAILGRLTENNVNLEEEIVKENVKPKSSYTIVTTDFNAFRKVICDYMKMYDLRTIKDVALKCNLSKFECNALMNIILGNEENDSLSYDYEFEQYYRYYDVMRKCIDYVNIDLWYGKY